MSVVVVGMEMPENCHVCVLCFGGLCFAIPPEVDVMCPDEGRPVWCPLRPLPEKHGDLIDRNAMLEEAKRISGPFTGDGWDNWGVYALIDRQPTIVEAEWQSEPLTISGTAYFIKDVIYLDPDLNQMEEE